MSTWVNVRLRIIGFFGKTRTIVTCGHLKHRFAALTQTALLAAFCGIVSAQQFDSAQNAGPDGQALVAKAARRLSQQPSIEARLRHQVELFGQQLVGSGVYLQKRCAAGLLVRLELNTGLGDELTKLLQISDGDFLWICRDFGDATTVGRVNLNRIRRTLDSDGREPHPDTILNEVAWGGLPRLLSGLVGNFDFGPARPANLGDTKVWVARGVWKREKLAELLPSQKDAILAGESVDWRQLAAHLPNSVLVVLDQGDLVPYRVEFGRWTYAAAPKARDGSGTATRPLAVLELFDVRRGVDIDERHFVYQATEESVIDQTDLYLQKRSRLPRTRGQDR